MAEDDSNPVALAHADRPEGQGEHYRFFVNEVTGQVFKATQSVGVAADNSPALKVCVSPVGPDGKALFAPGGGPDLYHLSHTFTATELAEPGFDLAGRVSAILHEAVRAKEAQLGVRAGLGGLAELWAGTDGIHLARRA